MTDIGTQIAGVAAAAAVAAGGLLGGAATGGTSGADSPTPDAVAVRTALVIDAAAGRDGRELVDPRLRDVDADVRLPRTAAEARTNVRYFEALGYRVVVAGPRASAAASAVGAPAVRAPDLTGALQAAAP